MSTRSSNRTLRQGQMVNGYRLQKLLGVGTQGAVWEVCNPTTRTTLAMKFQKDHAEAAYELEILRRVPNHPNVIKLFNSFVHGPYHVMALEFLGITLSEYLSKYGKISPRNTVRAGGQLTMGLKYLFDHGIMHRDFHGKNIAFDVKYEKLKILDLGIGALTRTHRDNRPRYLFYLSPAAPVDVHRGAAYSNYSDMISLIWILLDCRYIGSNVRDRNIGKMAEKKEKFLENPMSLLKPADSFLAPIVKQIYKNYHRHESYSSVLTAMKKAMPGLNFKTPFDKKGRRLE